MRESLRVLSREPRFCATVALVLGLCLGINSALFMVVNALLLRPLPFPHSERLLEISAPAGGLRLDDLEQVRSIEAAGATASAGIPVTDGGDVRMAFGFRVTRNLIPLLQLRPALGRALEASDFGTNVAMLGYEYWRRLGARPDIAAQPLTIDGEPYSIVGVLDADFFLGVRDAALIVPNLRGEGRTIARLRPGATAVQAQAEIAALAPGSAVQVTPLGSAFRSSDGRPVLLLLATSGLVLLIACANLANLQLVRGLARRRELAIRTALGATTGRLSLQLAAESAAIAVGGAAVGLLLTRIFHGAILAMLPANISRRMVGADALALDLRVLAFTAGAAMIVILLFGVLPAFSSMRFDILAGLREPLRGAGRARQRWGQALVICEIALALTLLTGAGLAFKSLAEMQSQYLGFRPEGVLRAMKDFSQTRYPEPQQRANLFAEVERRIGSIPGVASVGIVAPQAFPFGGPGVRGARFEIPGKPGAGARAEVYFANPAYRDAIGLPLLRGRWFDAGDALTSRPVAVLSHTVAQSYWGAGECIGQEVVFDSVRAVVIGVAGDVKNPIAGHWQPVAYRPLAQSPTSGATLMVRALVGDPLSLAPAIRRELRAIDPAAPDMRITATLAAAVRDYVSPQRFTVTLLAVFAAAGWALAAAGVYAVMRHWVASRTPEIGIRVALGARRSDVLALVMGRAIRTALIGAASGIAGAYAARKALASQVAGIDSVDPAVLCPGIAALLATAALAAWIPARTAASVDPAEALRAE